MGCAIELDDETTVECVLYCFLSNGLVVVVFFFFFVVDFGPFCTVVVGYTVDFEL
jgi:hypothetical protein